MTPVDAEGEGAGTGIWSNNARMRSPEEVAEQGVPERKRSPFRLY